jgi:hypothetical protein
MEKSKSYIRYSTDAPIEFGEVMAIQTLGFALGPDVVNRIQPKALYHNSYSVFVGQSTFARKDTVQELLGETIVPIECHLPKSGSPEAFLEEMCEHNSGFQFAGEWSRELKGIKTGSYLATFAELKNDLVKPRRYRKRLVSKGGNKREFIVDKPYLCINTTITPEVLKECVTTEMMDGGYFARHIVVSGEIKPRKRERLQQEAIDIKKRLCEEWLFVDGLDKSNCVFELSDEALKYYNDVVEEEIKSEEFSKIRSSAGRYLDYIITFADILLVSEALGELIEHDRTHISMLVELVTLVKLVNNNIVKYSNPTNGINPTNPTNLLTDENGVQVMVAQKRHVEEAWRILKKCLYNALEIANYVDMEKPLARIRNYLMKHQGKKVAHSVALRNTNVTAKQFEEAIKTLKQRDEVVSSTIKYMTKKGKLNGKQAYIYTGRNKEFEERDKSYD